MKVVKQIWENQTIRKIFMCLGIFCSFFVLDLFLRIYANQQILLYSWIAKAPNLFTWSWIFLFLGILLLLPKKVRIIFYTFLIILSNILVYAEYLYFHTLNRFFSFSDLLMVKEGSDYFFYAIAQTSKKMLFFLIFSFCLIGITIFIMIKTKEEKKTKKEYIKIMLITLIFTGASRTLAIYSLGVPSHTLTWEAAYNPKNIYIDYNNPTKSLEVSGIYELLFRSTYLYIRDNLIIDNTKIKQEIDAYLLAQTLEYQENDYTGLLEGKNVIYILMESIDKWLVTEDVMPTLKELENSGLNFTNRYAPALGGGQTINSEFAMNTGLYAVENSKAIYNFNRNDFSASLANMLKNYNYSTVSIHANTGNFYNRTAFHKALGYDYHYALEDMKNINHTDYNYYKDSSLVKNEETYDLIVREEPFLSFITTYSAHLPYDESNPLCNENLYNLNVLNNQELSCIRNLARETDEMLRILLEKLEKDNLLENTVLVLATDHYTYGYDDQEYIKKIKKTDNEYLLQNVPLVIWSKSIAHKQINTLMDTADILPTLLNLLGIEYNPKNYIGTDVFSENHESFVFFGEDLFYDGKQFYGLDEESTVENEETINAILKKVKEKIQINDKMIVSNYFQNK